MRERVEDLGRISVMIDCLLDSEFFDLYGGRTKDFEDYFEEQTSDKKSDLINKMIYGLSHIKDKLQDISDIADGRDSLNEPP